MFLVEAVESTLSDYETTKINIQAIIFTTYPDIQVNYIQNYSS